MRFEPAKAARKIAAAWKIAETEKATAERLACGRTSLQRWVKALEAAGYNARTGERLGVAA